MSSSINQSELERVVDSVLWEDHEGGRARLHTQDELIEAIAQWHEAEKQSLLDEHEQDMRDARRLIAAITKQEGGEYQVDRAQLLSVDEMTLERTEPLDKDGIVFRLVHRTKTPEQTS